MLFLYNNTMNDLLNYYYKIMPINIVSRGTGYVIKTNDSYFLFDELNESTDNLKELIDSLNTTDIKYHLIVLTSNKEIVTNYNNKNYVLLKIRNKIEDLKIVKPFIINTKPQMVKWQNI